MALTADDAYKAPQPKDNEGKEENLNEVQISTLVSTIQKRFTGASSARRQHEDRMISAYNNFRGLYGKQQQFRESEKSRIFVKATKTKVLAGYGQVIDITLGGEKYPIGVTATKIPEGIEDIAHIAPQTQAPVEDEPEAEYEYNVGYAGDGKELPAGTTFGSDWFKKYLPKLGNKAKKEEFVQPGPSPDPNMVTFSPAEEAAIKMDKLMQDQLQESNATSETLNAVFESAMLGTGVIKGPFTYVKTLNKWCKNEETGKREYKPIHVKVPKIEFVSVWDAYPDPNATCKDELSFFIHRHRLNPSQMRDLAKMPLFDKEKIDLALMNGPNYVKQSYEDQVTSSSLEGERDFADRYEVLEYWGTMGVKESNEVGLDTTGLDDLGEIQINAWVCGGLLLRIAANPFTPNRIPYHIFNYERNPYSIFGVGIPENMSDSQAMMNGHARMAVDNLALAGGLVFDIDETALVAGQDMSIYNGKIFYRQAGQPGQAVHGIKFPNTAQENLMMFDKFRQLADEETGLPSYSHGSLGAGGMTRTASGMSMLMGAASLTIKTVIRNLDHQLFQPLGKDLFQWNMQFYEGDLEVEGDLEINALGTQSLMQKEVRSQRMTMFLQTVLNPQLAPLVKLPYIIEELAKGLDLDKDKVINSTAEQRAYAELMGLMNGPQAGQGADALGDLGLDGASAGLPPGAESLGATGNGNGNIGTGIVPQSGEAGFSGNAP
jgi:hypothetical protein